MDNKRQRTGDNEGSAAPPSCLDVSDWESLAMSYEARDETIEVVIKRCRNMQVGFKFIPVKAPWDCGSTSWDTCMGGPEGR